MISWEISKRNGIVGLYIRDYSAQGIPPDWMLFKKLNFSECRYLLDAGLANGDHNDIDRWESVAAIAVGPLSESKVGDSK